MNRICESTIRRYTRIVRMTKKKVKKLPKPAVDELGDGRRTLPFNGGVINKKRLLFSFASFDRTHTLFNLGGKSEDKTVGGQ